MLTEPHIKERLSVAYASAIAGRAGVNVSHSFHDYGVDGSFHPIKKVAGGFVQSGFSVEFQLKASVNWEVKGAAVSYDLEARAYNNIVERDPCEIPLILILMCLPRNERQWLRQSEAGLLLQKSCYWYWMPRGVRTKNAATVRISIPRSNLLDVEGLTRLMAGAEAYQRGLQDHV